tara:strand:- start:40 stop:465 length:426 start_codon:yes stop_codon:yes gene_type:complete
MTVYNSRIEVDNFQMLSSSEASILRSLSGKICQKGIRYPAGPDHNIVVFTSKNANDLMNALEHGFWDHTQKALHVDKGDTVYVITNEEVSKKLGTIVGIKGIALERMYKLSSTSSTTWSSTLMKDTDALLDKAIEVEDTAA